MAEPFNQRNFEEYEAVRKPKRNAEANTAANGVLAELALRAIPRLRELAQGLLRFEMTQVFDQHLEGFVHEGWPPEAEYLLWRAVEGTPRVITPEAAAALRELSVEAGGWWARLEPQDTPSFLSHEDWARLYRPWLLPDPEEALAMDEKTETLKKIGGMLRAARGKLSLHKAGLKIGVSTAYLSDVERGYRTVSAIRLRQIADAVGMRDGERMRLFVAAQMLPPAVTAQVLQAPAAWSYGYKRLFNFAQEVQSALKSDPTLARALGDKTCAALERALQKMDW